MLLSILLVLTPTTPIRLSGFYGRYAQAWLLDQVRSFDPELAEELHRPGKQRPYTVSSLITPHAGRREPGQPVGLAPGNICLLRFTSLSPRLSDLLLSRVTPGLHHARLRLRDLEFKVLRLSLENGWDGQASFEHLARQAGERGEASVTLQFASPTAFRSGGIDQTLPTPEQVWRSLWWRWNSFAPEELHIDPLWPEFARNCIVVSDFTLRSTKIGFQDGIKGAATGCTGQATYRLLAEKHCRPYAALWPGAAQVLNALASFALYSGIGHHTTVGLGQARQLPVSSRPEAESLRPYLATV